MYLRGHDESDLTLRGLRGLRSHDESDLTLASHDESDMSLGSIFNRAKKAVSKALKKTAPINKLAVRVNPLMLQGRASNRTIKSLLTTARRVPANLRTGGLPMLRMTTRPKSFQPRPATFPSVNGPLALPAPAASIPDADQDDDGSEITIEERAAYIEDTEPLVEPYASGLVPSDGEESFAPNVPEMIHPEDVTPTPPKRSPALPIGGIILLLSLLS